MIYCNSKDPYKNIKSIDCSPYTLKSKSQLNAKTGSSLNREGFLLRVLFHGIGYGYCDCFVFEELGDLSLKQQLKLLQEKQLSTGIRKSLMFSYIDAENRSHGINIFQNIKSPSNHFTCTNISQLNHNILLDLKNNGFRHIKIKCGLNLENEMNQIQKLYSILKDMNIKLRIDFNSSLNIKTISYFLDSILKFSSIFDFIEDPTPFVKKDWFQLLSEYPSIKLGLDRDSLFHLKNNCINRNEYFQYLVIKPAQQLLTESFIKSYFSHIEKVIFTSYMDHPLGQLCALYEAASLYEKCPDKQENCGFLTHHLYETNAYSDCLTVQNTKLIPSSEGYGFGFDRLLENENWRNVSEY